ncbi:MAG: hypothetical protein ACK55I_04755, partial [bacterium]
MRITIGTSDFCPLPFYSYDDVAIGEVDLNLERFSTQRDEEYIIPMIQEAIAAAAQGNSDDELLFLASPWSGPAWMKTSGNLSGGIIKEEYYQQYAEYLA